MADPVLLHTPADILRRLLVDLGLASDAVGAPNPRAGVWPAYASKEPAHPDEVITTYTTSGARNQRSMIDGEVLGMYSFQVRVRSTDPRSGYLKSSNIHKMLSENVYDATVTISESSYLFHAASSLTEVVPLPPGQSDMRSLHTFNGVAAIRRVA